MELKLIGNQYHCLTYSSETVLSTLNGLHQVQNPLVWTPSSGGTQEWLKINLYYLTEIREIEIKWDGACDTFKIEYSIDNFNWNTLSDTFEPDDKVLSIDYTGRTVDAVFLKFIVNSPSGFVLEDFDVTSEVEWENTDIISHNYLRAYGINYRDNYPLFPSIIMDVFKMMENYNNINKKLYDPNVYTSTVASCSKSGSTGQLSVSNLTVDSSLQYIWDYDDVNVVYEEGNDGEVDIGVDATLFKTDIDLSDYSVNEFVGRYLVINSGMNKGSYEILTNTNSLSNNEIVLTSSLSYTLTDMDFKIQDISETQLLANPNIIVTIDPTTNPVDHEYISTGTYYPRLVILSSDYILEFVTSITIT